MACIVFRSSTNWSYWYFPSNDTIYIQLVYAGTVTFKKSKVLTSLSFHSICQDRCWLKYNILLWIYLQQCDKSGKSQWELQRQHLKIAGIIVFRNLSKFKILLTETDKRFSFNLHGQVYINSCSQSVVTTASGTTNLLSPVDKAFVASKVCLGHSVSTTAL